MKVGRNDSCPCGSGRKYKHCCARRQTEREKVRDSISRAVFYVLVPLTLVVLVAVAVSALRRPEATGEPEKVWSPAHNHWHYRLPDGSEIEARPGMVWSKDEGRFVQAAPIVDAARKHVRSRLEEELSHVTEDETAAAEE